MEEHWMQFKWLFEDLGYEVYESMQPMKHLEEYFEEGIGAPQRQKLIMRDILERIKVKYYELEEVLESSEFTTEQAEIVMKRWLSGLTQANSEVVKANVSALISGELLNSQAKMQEALDIKE